MGTARAKFQTDAPESEVGENLPAHKNFRNHKARPGGHSGKVGMKKHKRSKRR